MSKEEHELVSTIESEWWDKWHRTVRLPGEPLPLAIPSVEWFKKKKVECILELGFGQLNDARFFSGQGFKIHGLDFSSKAVEMAKKIILEESLSNITVQKFDFSHHLPFLDQEFDAVYSHFSLHYFDQSTTQNIFSDINRVLKKSGLFIFNVKSVKDLKYGKGNKIGPDMFDDAGNPGHIRHFFRRETLSELLAPLFDIIEIKESVVFYHTYDAEALDVIAVSKE